MEFNQQLTKMSRSKSPPKSKLKKQVSIPKKVSKKTTKQKKSDIMSITCYTDGSYSGKNDAGSWCAYMDCNGVSTVIFGALKGTTVNRMELTAVVEALSFIQLPSIFYIKSDSAYVVNSISKRWVHGWAKNGWKTYTGNPVSNKDLWLKILELMKVHVVHIEWVKAHNGEPGNELVDTIAQSWRLNRYPY